MHIPLQDRARSLVKIDIMTSGTLSLNVHEDMSGSPLLHIWESLAPPEIKTAGLRAAHRENRKAIQSDIECIGNALGMHKRCM